MTTFEEWIDINNLTHESHQKFAVEWCVKRETEIDVKGGIIADEMGLGKTIEILGTMHCNPVPNTLIVVPYSVLGQWSDAITNLFHRKPLLYHGSNRKCLTKEDLQFHPIVLTTYGLISQRRITPHDELVEINPLCTIHWHRIIYDEAHHLRNKRTAIHEGALRLKTGITWLMTGTPIQNSVHDLYNLFSLLGLNNKKDIKKNMASYVRTYMLRRTKEEAGIVLPPCHSTNVEVGWKYLKEQKMAETIHARLTFSNVRGDAFEHDEPQGHFKLLSKAKKVCVLPNLLNLRTGNSYQSFEKYKGGKKIRYILEDSMHPLPTVNTLEAFNKTSKLESVIETILERSGNGKPKLVFCYFHKEIDELSTVLKQHGLLVQIIDGRTSKKERAKILQRPTEVLIGQIDATNEGLNLQEYKEIYMVSPHWNPAIEDQAIARCHRIGQTEAVHVFHFLMKGFAIEGDDAKGDDAKGDDAKGYDAKEAPITLDQHICNIQEHKRTIIKNVLSI